MTNKWAPRLRDGLSVDERRTDLDQVIEERGV